jgi:V8-like Glu-specific endopeptidase
VTGCKTTTEDSEVTSVFGRDSRVSLPDSYTFVGKLGRGCTAFAVGPRLIITAAHCTFGDNPLTWTPYRSSEKFSTSLLARGMSSSASTSGLYGAEVANDWAILKLDSKHDKWIDVSSNLKIDDKIGLLGYSYDLSGATGHNNCLVKKIGNNIIAHDCDMQGGASGGPIIKRIDGHWLAVGVQSTENCLNNKCHHEEWTLNKSNKGCQLGSEVVEKIKNFQVIFGD